MSTNSANQSEEVSAPFELKPPVTYRWSGGIPGTDPVLLSRWADAVQSIDVEAKNGRIDMDYDTLREADTTLAEDLVESPEENLHCGEHAARDHWKDNDLRIRVTGLNDATQIANIRSDDVGSLVSIKCQVAKTSKTQELDHLVVVQCSECGNLFERAQNPYGGPLEKPNGCEACGAGSRSMEPTSNRSVAVDSQKIIVRDLHEVSRSSEPADMLAHIDDDLLCGSDRVDAGDRVTVTAIVRRVRKSQNGQATNENDFWLYIVGIEPEKVDFEGIEITDEEVESIRAIANREDCIQYLTNSLAPTVMGDFDDVKLSLLLQLVGSSEITGDDIRRMMHLLLLGEPATAKSKLMRAVRSIAAVVEFVSGDDASAAGLTASNEHEDRFGESRWTLKAGALPKAHKGLTVIDELDKASESVQQALHTPTEEGFVEVQKAASGKLMAETDILVGANPVDERFGYDEVIDQVPFKPALFSRFDLVWVIKDQPGTDIDRNIIESRGDLLKSDGPTHDPIDEGLLQKYVAYARRNVHPALTDEAVDYIGDKFFALREQSSGGRVSVTHRKYDALVRLSLAMARLRLSETATVEDARWAYDLLVASLKQVGLDPETGQFDADIVETGRSNSQRTRKQDLFAVVEEYDDVRVPLEHILTEMVERGHEDTAKVMHDLDKAEEQGDLFEPEDGEFVYVR